MDIILFAACGKDNDQINYVCPIVMELVDDVIYQDGIAAIVYSMDDGDSRCTEV